MANTRRQNEAANRKERVEGHVAGRCASRVKALRGGVNREQVYKLNREEMGSN